jgi:monoamine oxidase
MAEVGTDDQILDVAIVGGGVSGVYSAWRLITSEPGESHALRRMAAERPDGKLKICVFEGSRRIGGRMLSVTPPGMPHISCELGGMRYMSSQPLIRSLVENKLKLETRPLPVAEPENIAYLRGRRLRLRELSDPDKVPYALSWVERGLDPANLVGYAVNQIVPGVTSLHGQQLRQLLQHSSFEGKPLYQEGFWNLLARTLSREAYELAQQSGGYDTTVLNWNAVDTILLNFDFTPDVTFSAVVKGYEQVPISLCHMFEQAGGELRKRRWLRSFDVATLPDGTSGVKLVFWNLTGLPADADEKNFAGESVGKVETVLARNLILAMPRRSLELLEPSGAVLGPEHAEVHQLIRSVTPIPLFKTFVCYHTPWWQSTGVTVGRSVTDLPIRQCYYWGVEGAQNGADKSNTNAVLMATYDDTLNVNFWAGYRSKAALQDHYHTKPNRFMSTSDDKLPWHQYKAPKAMVDEMQRQLIELHGLRFAPEPYAAAFQDWGDDPYGGGVNFWNIHAKSWEVIPRIVKPKPNVPVYICGEAYSNGQGWVEGALQTAELVLQDHFHLPAPDWVTAG